MKWGVIRNIFSEYNIAISINLDMATHCHALITGSSGSGKSYALLYLLGTLLQSEPNIIVYFCDFKNSDDFRFLKDYRYYYSGNNCYKGIMDYYNAFSESRINDTANTRYILIFDEYPAFVNYLQAKDKQEKTKYSNDVLSAIAEILMLGRGIGFGVWIITQRPDANLFSNGARDNFMIVISLGRLSKEQKGMIFSGEDIPENIYEKGEGLLLSDGHELKEVKFPKIRDVSNWRKHILSIITQ